MRTGRHLMRQTALLPIGADHGSSGDTQVRRYLWSSAWTMAVGAMALMGVKPLFDIPGKKAAADTVDAGMVATTTGALLMVASFVVVAAMSKRIPAKLAPALIALLVLGVFSAVNLLAVPARDDFLQNFTATNMRDIFGSYVPPVDGTLTQAAQLAVGFAPVTLLAVMLVKPGWFSVERMRWVLLLVVFGAVVHSAIAWLQVAGVVPYTFFFKLPTGNIGRASGAYFHPASLGRLLIFAVFILYAAGDRLRLKPLPRYSILALLVATAIVSTHRLTILCVAIMVVGLERRRLPLLLQWIYGLRFRTAVSAGVILVVLAVVLVIRWGSFLWDRGLFLLTQVGSLDITSKEFMRGRGEIWFEIAEVWRHAAVDVWLIGLGYEPWNTHSDPLRIFVVWGLLGVILMTVILVTLWRVTRSLIGAEGRWALSVLYIAAAFFAITQKPTSYPYFMWLFILSHMLVIAVYPRVDALSPDAVRNGGHR